MITTCDRRDSVPRSNSRNQKSSFVAKNVSDSSTDKTDEQQNNVNQDSINDTELRRRKH